ncbi:MAG: acyl-CoA dehydratase activase-related protein [Dehalococcoidales bacterium]|nr:acyl-CoA dehydratase activase-related protein [Dehalococcoidales bacterium]
MKYKVGIPRALLYYKYFPMWQKFLSELGAELVVSDITNKRTISQGAARVVSDTCFPVKVFIGHVVSLTDRCDSLLIPIVRSTKRKVYNCSRFLGLPDLTRAVVSNTPPIWEIEFDRNRGQNFLYRQIYSLGSRFTRNPLKIKEAADKAWESHVQYKKMMCEQNLMRVEVIKLIQGQMVKPEIRDNNQLMTIGLVGHPYVLHDEQISHYLIKRLLSYGLRVLTPEMVPEMSFDYQSGAQVAGLARSYWESEEDILEAGEYYIGTKVDGIIGMMPFACGPDSLMMNLIQRNAQKAGIPFICLTVEEHTADAGIVTRLEAFLDMISRDKRR